MRILAVLVCGSLVLALPTGAAPVPKGTPPSNIIQNGGFEDGPKNDLLVSLAPKSEAIKGWTVTRGSIDHIGPFWDSPREGKRCVDLHGSPGYGGIQQKIPTVKNVKYRLTFHLASTPGCAKPKKSMAVEIDAVKTAFTCDSTGHGKPHWTKQTLDFTATDKETTIEFYTLETEDPNCGPVIDGVSVVRAH